MTSFYSENSILIELSLIVQAVIKQPTIQLIVNYNVRHFQPVTYSALGAIFRLPADRP